jgi:ATP-binding protein involved in chromosome partitioning
VTVELHDRVWEALRTVPYPGYRRDVVSFGLVQKVTAQAGVVGVALAVAHLPPAVQEELEREVRRAVLALPGVRAVEVVRVAPPGLRRVTPAEGLPRGDKLLAARVLGVVSGKGGVGKSTVTANLAAAMAAEGLKAGILDADVYGFSIARMMGVREAP